VSEESMGALPGKVVKKVVVEEVLEGEVTCGCGCGCDEAAILDREDGKIVCIACYRTVQDPVLGPICGTQTSQWTVCHRCNSAIEDGECYCGTWSRDEDGDVTFEPVLEDPTEAEWTPRGVAIRARRRCRGR